MISENVYFYAMMSENVYVYPLMYSCWVMPLSSERCCDTSESRYLPPKFKLVNVKRSLSLTLAKNVDSVLGKVSLVG